MGCLWVLELVQKRFGKEKTRHGSKREAQHHFTKPFCTIYAAGPGGACVSIAGFGMCMLRVLSFFIAGSKAPTRV